MSDEDISIQALYKRSYVKAIEITSNEIYKSIADKIKEAAKNGMCEIYYNLPDNFNVGNLEPQDSQLLIYTDIIERLEKHGLLVSIIVRSGEKILHVKWPTKLDNAERERRKNYLKKHVEY